MRFLNGSILDKGAPETAANETSRWRQMSQRAIRMIHVEGATGAAFVPLRAEHEVIDDELASAVEQVSKSFLAIR